MQQLFDGVICIQDGTMDQDKTQTINAICGLHVVERCIVGTDHCTVIGLWKL